MSYKGKPENRIFSDNLRRVFNDWKQRTGGNQKKLADEVYSNQHSVSDWLTGKTKPEEETLQRICSVLNVTKEDLYKSSFENTVRFDKNYSEKLHKKNKEYIESIGLNEDFVKFLKDAIPDTEFPLTIKPYDSVTAMRKRPETDPEPICTTLVIEEYFESYVSDTNSHFQRKLNNGKTVNLSEEDFEFLRDVQNDVVSYIKYLYFKRKKDTAAQIKTAYEKAKKDGVVTKVLVYGKPVKTRKKVNHGKKDN